MSGADWSYEYRIMQRAREARKRLQQQQSFIVAAERFAKAILRADAQGGTVESNRALISANDKFMRAFARWEKVKP